MRRYVWVLWLAVGCEVGVVHDLPETAANDVMVALSAEGVYATKRRHGAQWDVLVDGADEHRALEALQRARLPRSHDVPLESLVATDALVVSPEDERYRRRLADAHQFRALLLTRVGVVDAEVVLAERGSLVTLVLETDVPCPRQQVEAQLRLVTSGQAEDVHVVCDAVAPPSDETPRWVSVAGVQMRSESAARAKAWLIGACGAVSILSAMLFGALVRR